MAGMDIDLRQLPRWRIIRFVVPASVALIISAACARQPAFKPVGSVKQIMEAAIHPAAEVVFEAVGTILTVGGVEEIAPKNDEEWTKVRDNALILAESGNLLMIGDRAKDKGDWMKMSQALIDAGVIALRAAEAKNPEKLFEAGGQVYEACQQCHTKYANTGDASAK
jgi:hypothetical protein